MGGELVIFVGLQASGKSTFFRGRFAATHEHVSKDLFRNNRNRNRRQGQLVEAALRSGRPVVVDNTNPTVEDRRPLVELGRRFGGDLHVRDRSAPLVELGRRFGARVVGYHFDSGVRGCLARNASREGKARVPDVAIFATATRLAPPSREEGFDGLYRVRPNGPAFEVRAC